MGITQKRNPELIDSLRSDFAFWDSPAMANLLGTWYILNTKGVKFFHTYAQVGEPTTVYYDSTKLGMNLTPFNTVSTVSVGIITAAHLVNTTSYLHRNDETLLDFIGSFAIGGWFKVTNVDLVQILMSKYSSTTNRTYQLHLTATNQVRFCVYNTAWTEYSITTTTGIGADEWFFAGGRYATSTEIQAFLNDEVVSLTMSIPATLGNSSAPLRIGRRGDGLDGFVGYTTFNFGVKG